MQLRLSRRFGALLAKVVGCAAAPLALLIHLPPSIAFIFVLILLGAPLTMADFRDHRLPNALTGALLLTSLSIVTISCLARHRYQSLRLSAIGALLSVSFYLLVALLSRGGLGAGDIKLSASLGVISGFYSFSMLWVSTCLAIASAAFFAIWVITCKKAKVESAIAFGPFMLLGQLIPLLFLLPKGI